MNLTAAQVREACALLRWRSARLARNAGIGFDKACMARDDQGIASLSSFDLRAVREALQRSGVQIGADGAMRLRKAP